MALILSSAFDRKESTRPPSDLSISAEREWIVDRMSHRPAETGAAWIHSVVSAIFGGRQTKKKGNEPHASYVQVWIARSSPRGFHNLQAAQDRHQDQADTKGEEALTSFALELSGLSRSVEPSVPYMRSGAGAKLMSWRTHRC